MTRWLRWCPTAALALLAACGGDSSTDPSADPDFAGSGTPPSILLTYICGNKFSVRSTQDTTVVVTYEVANTPLRGTLTLPPVRLFSNGTLIDTEANLGKLCAAGFKLAVVLERGVVATPALRDSTYALGAVVSYSYAAKPGHQNVLVTLDGLPVPSFGAVPMLANHVLVASADSQPQVTQADEVLLARARAVLTAGDPVSAYQTYFDQVSDLIARVSPQEAKARLSQRSNFSLTIQSTIRRHSGGWTERSRTTRFE